MSTMLLNFAYAATGCRVQSMSETYWDGIRAWIEDGKNRLGLSMPQLARAAGMSPAALSRFLGDKTRRLHIDSLAGVERVLGPCPVPGVRNSASSDTSDASPSRTYVLKSLHSIPLVDIRRFPRGVAAAERPARLEAVSMGRTLTVTEDPAAFALFLPEATGRYPAGSHLIISPATPALAGERAAIELPDRVAIAEMTDVDGLLVPIVDGRAWPQAAILGRVMAQVLPE